MELHHIERLKNVILYILRAFPGGTDYIRLYKILYFANREQLARVGVPITLDKFKAWDYGPVPSYTGALVKTLEEREPLKESQIIFRNVIKVRKNKLVKTEQEPDIETIPALSRDILDKYIHKYHYYDSRQLSQESHDEAWREAYEDRGGKHNGRVVIKADLMAKCAGADEETLKFVSLLYGKEKGYVHVDGSHPDVYDALGDALMDLDAIAGLPEGWDGDDAFAINPLAVINARWLLIRREFHPEWIDVIYPTQNGTLCINWKHNGAKVSTEIADDQMGFYYVSPNKEVVYDSPLYAYDDEVGSEDLSSHISLLGKRK